MSRFYSIPVLCTMLLFAVTARAQVSFEVDTSLSAKELIQHVWLDSTRTEGLAFSKIKHTGAITSVGHFAYTGLAGDLPKSGIILSTGDVMDAKGPNLTNRSRLHYTPGDSLLETIASGSTFDASTLSFEFNSFTDSISFAFVFASEEYMEYVDEGVSDVFGFFCREKGTTAWQNLATLPGSNTPITVDLINAHKNEDYYQDNKPYNEYTTRYFKGQPEVVERAWLLEFDGFTKGIGTGVAVKPYSTYEFRISIADVGDNRFDSWVMLVGQSFKSSGKIVTPGLKQLKSFLSIVDQDLDYTQNGDTLNITSQLYFDFDSSDLRPVSTPLLESMAKVMRFSTFRLTVLGYADPSGTENYNMQLSQARADQVRNFLTERGISTERIKSMGMGEYTPENDDAQARKVVFQLVSGE